MSPHTKVALVTGRALASARRSRSRSCRRLSRDAYRTTQGAAGAGVLEAGAVVEQALIVPTDVRDPPLCGHCSRRPRGVWSPRVLFNNAGVSAPGIALEDLSYEQWQAVVDTNLTGAFLCTQEAFKIMKSQIPGRAHH